MVDTVISDAQTPTEFVEARQLIEEYAASIGLNLSFQDYASELESIREIYSPPDGCILLARQNGKAVGCVALRLFTEGTCEMKRLYVKPRARGSGLGRKLATHVIQRARSIGYNRMLLDTLDSMDRARSLYRSLGFLEISPYYENPLGDTTYMALDLVKESV